MTAQSMPSAEKGAGAEGLGALADRSALPDTWEEGPVSMVNGAEGRECVEVPGRGSDRVKREPGELCFKEDKGCTEVAPPADSRMGSGPEESCFLLHFTSCGSMLGAGGTAGAGATPAAGEGGELKGCTALQFGTASVSPQSTLLMCWNAAFFSESRSSAVTRKPSSGGDGNLRGSLRLCGSRGNLRFGGLELSGVGEQFLQVRFCPFVTSASFSCWLFLWENTEAENSEAEWGDEEPSWLTFFEDSWVWDVDGTLLVCTGRKS